MKTDRVIKTKPSGFTSTHLYWVTYKCSFTKFDRRQRMSLICVLPVLSSTSATVCCSTSHGVGLYYAEASQT